MKVSVITPVYNGVATIERTIQSVISQGVDDLEYIIVDGLSSDGTDQIVGKYLDRMYSYIREKDRGVYDAIDKGIAAASGEIIGIINSDDWFEDDAIKRVIDLFEHTDADLVYGDINIIDGDKTTLYSAGDLRELCTGMSIPHPGMFVRRDIYEKYGVYDLNYRIAADYDFVLRCYMAKVKFAYADTVLANFSLGGLSDTSKQLCKTETQDVMKRHIDDELLRQCFSDLLDKNLIIHGAGFWGKWLVEKLKHLYTEDVIWIDRSCEKQYSTELGIDIHPYDECEFDRQVVVAIYDADNIISEYISKGYDALSIKEILDKYMDLVYSR